MELYLIRHAKTRGNREGRYIGSTDEPLTEDAASEAAARRYPPVDRVYASPMLRCLQTAGLLFPDVTPRVLDDLRECDFGAFEGKTYEDLRELPAYRAWIDAAGEGTPPGGESAESFRRRCCTAFSRAVRECLADGVERAAFVIHGGTVMTLMNTFAGSAEPRGFYDWQVPNLEGWAVNTALYSRVERWTLLEARRIDGRGEPGCSTL